MRNVSPDHRERALALAKAYGLDSLRREFEALGFQRLSEVPERERAAFLDKLEAKLRG